MSAPYRFEVVTGWDGEQSLVTHAVTQSEWDELVAERDRLRDAIHAHRDTVKCCDECAEAQTEDRSTVDGILWAEVDR